MKTIGILGGLGPESTSDYYNKIISAFNNEFREFAYPEIIILSANLNEFMDYANKSEWEKITNWLVGKISRLHQAGADFVAMASNSPHIVFDEIKERISIPLVSIVEQTCNVAKRMKLKNAGLLGTKLTMESDYYIKPFIKNNISVVVPSSKEIDLIQHRLFSEIELGIIKDSTRIELLNIVKRMKEEESIDSLILGCTELPLILTNDEYEIPFLNTTSIHCQSIVEYCLNGHES